MHRLTAILLFAALLLPFAAPLLALGQKAEADLPLCCRRDGAHHCSMSRGERAVLLTAAEQTPSWRAPLGRCPYCPATPSASHADPLHAPVLATADPLPGYSHPAGVVQTESRRRIARDRSRQKRGPPLLSLL